MGDTEEHIVRRLLNSIPEGEPVSLHQLTCASGLNYRTVTKYIELIIAIQEAHKVVLEPKGMRMVIKKDLRMQRTPSGAKVILNAP